MVHTVWTILYGPYEREGLIFQKVCMAHTVWTILYGPYYMVHIRYMIYRYYVTGITVTFFMISAVLEKGK